MGKSSLQKPCCVQQTKESPKGFATTCSWLIKMILRTILISKWTILVISICSSFTKKTTTNKQKKDDMNIIFQGQFTQNKNSVNPRFWVPLTSTVWTKWTWNCLLTTVLHNICFCVPQKKEIHTGGMSWEWGNDDNFHFWVNYPFKTWVMCWCPNMKRQTHLIWKWTYLTANSHMGDVFWLWSPGRFLSTYP